MLVFSLGTGLGGTTFINILLDKAAFALKGRTAPNNISVAIKYNNKNLKFII
jgi:hypothetical protein